jgi:hypothetical protein
LTESPADAIADVVVVTFFSLELGAEARHVVFGVPRMALVLRKLTAR